MIKTESVRPDRTEQQVGPRNSSLIKPILPEIAWDLPNEDRTRHLVNTTLNLIFKKFDRQKRAFWLKKFEHYSKLSVGTSKEKKLARNFVTKTAGELLQNPQDIHFAQETLTNIKNNVEAQDPKQQFFQLVNNECLTLIKDKWEKVAPEQIAQLIRIYASNDPSKDTAKALLANYLKCPKSRSRRIDAYYNFVSGVLNLAEEDEAFREGMKIALHATDVLPRIPSLVEQTGLLSLPYGEVESVFKKLLIARAVIAQVRFIGSWNLDKYYEDRGNFITTNSVAIEKGNKRKGNVERKIGANETREMYYKMKATMRFIANGSIESLSEERKQALMGTWPFNLAFDETDPLNQKFQEVLSQRTALKTP